MKYTSSTKKLIPQLGGLAKPALDLAEMLDHPLFQVKGEESYTLRSSAERREKVFNLYCAVLTQAGIPLPTLEPDLYKHHAKNDADEKQVAAVKATASFARAQLGRKKAKNAKQIEALLATAELFPGVAGWNGLTLRQIEAKVNEILVASGLNPVRPDYSKFKLEFPDGRAVPQTTLKVFIVDDDVSEIAKTMMALAGWRNLALIPFHHSRNRSDSEKQVRLVATATKIIEMKPDVILMDQGLDNQFDGSELISVIRQQESKLELRNRIVFVANTGGSPGELESVGAYRNCAKGSDLSGVERAIISTGGK